MTTATGLLTDPGLYLGVPEDVYHRDPVEGGSLSSTGCRRIVDTCPAKFKWEAENGRLSTRSMDFGTAAHTMVLGTGKPIHVLENPDGRTSEGRIEKREALAGGYIVLKPEEYERIKGMADALRAHPLASTLFARQRYDTGQILESGGDAEVTGVWRDELTGVMCRLRLDWLPAPSDGRLIIPDYKTTTDASPEACAKSIARYGYHRQREFYLSGLRSLGIGNASMDLLLVFQETTAPFLVTVVAMDPQMRQAGKRMNRRGINLYAQCKREDRWPGYNNDRTYTAELPAWQLKEEQ